MSAEIASDVLSEDHRPRVFGISGGRSSAYMLHQVLESGDIRKTDVFSFQNTGKEKPETLDFLHEIETRWKIPLVWLEYVEGGFVQVDYETASRNGEPFDRLLSSVQHGNYLPNVMLRLCTYHLKVKTLQAYLETLGIKKYNAFSGIRADEPKRVIKADLSNLSGKNRYHYVLPLHRNGITEVDVKAFWSAHEFDLKIDSIQGNCDLCFLKGKHKLVSLIRQDPASADWWIEKEKQTGKTFHKRHSYTELRELALTQLEIPGMEWDWNAVECIGCTD